MKKALCALVGQSSHLINETNAIQMVLQTGANCFCCEDLILQLGQICAIKLLKASDLPGLKVLTPANNDDAVSYRDF